tara:strand:+ start:507 stop:749 length:243 start_codon:yes stop_codon:yes gene_type:complete
MIDYYLKPGDLIITKKNYGILLKKEKGKWHYMSRPHTHPTPEWYPNIISNKNLYHHLDEGSNECKVIYAPGKRRKRNKCP